MSWNQRLKRDIIHVAMDYDPKDFCQGMCGDYALALQEMYPHLRIGMHIDSFPKPLNPFTTPTEEWGEAMDNHDQGWVPSHVFAHDDEYAYDSLGKHPLPYKSGNRIDHYNLTRQDVEDQGWPEGMMDEAKHHIQQQGIGPQR